MNSVPFNRPTGSPGPRRPVLPPRLFLDLPLPGLGQTSITGAQTPPAGVTEWERGKA